MHIPDGFLSPPVWAALDVAAVPVVGLLLRQAQRREDPSRLPLLGVMGAFVFAAQMINFPVGAGTSGHLVGSALLAVCVGPAAATLVMTAILVVQALVFQDGGILALGANLLNMAVCGVWLGYLPYHLWGAGRARKAALFLGGALSVMGAALLALAELSLSGVAVPPAVLGISLTLFAVSALIEGAITMAVVGALERMNPRFVTEPGRSRGVRSALALAAVSLVVVGVLFASTQPDGLESVAHRAGITAQAQTLLTTPWAEYETRFLESAWLRRATAGLLGLLLVYGVCLLGARVLAGRRAGRLAADVE